MTTISVTKSGEYGPVRGKTISAVGISTSWHGIQGLELEVLLYDEEGKIGAGTDLSYLGVCETRILTSNLRYH